MANNKDDINKVRCSFCGKTQDQVRRIVAGPGAYICNECVLLCQEIVSDDVESVGAHGEIEIKKPQEIKEVLDQYVVGQDAAKKALSVAVYFNCNVFAVLYSEFFTVLIAHMDMAVSKDTAFFKSYKSFGTDYCNRS